MATLQKPAKKKTPHQLQKTTTFSHHKSSQPHGFGLMGFLSAEQQVKSSSTEQHNRIMTRFLTSTTGKKTTLEKKSKTWQSLVMYLGKDLSHDYTLHKNNCSEIVSVLIAKQNLDQ
jgi:hypothetical protein